MRLEAIIDECGNESVREARHMTDEYAELVVYNTQMEGWNSTILDLLGAPKKPAGAQPAEEDSHLTKDYGGIWPDQTLFYKDFGAFVLMVMYWTWQDGVHTTVKIARITK